MSNPIFLCRVWGCYWGNVCTYIVIILPSTKGNLIIYYEPLWLLYNSAIDYQQCRGGGGGVENWFGLDLKHYVVLSLIPLPLLFSQRAKKVVSDSPGLMDFAIGLVNCVLNLPDGQVKFWEQFKLKNCEINSAHPNVFGASWNNVWASIC